MKGSAIESLSGLRGLMPLQTHDDAWPGRKRDESDELEWAEARSEEAARGACACSCRSVPEPDGAATGLAPGCRGGVVGEGVMEMCCTLGEGAQDGAWF